QAFRERWYKAAPMASFKLVSLLKPGNPGCASLIEALLLVPLWPSSSASFTGALERVMDQSTTVLLPDGRMIDAELAAGAELSSSTRIAKLVFGDYVMIVCQPMPQVWDQAVNLPRTLELRTLRCSLSAQLHRG
ncbi:MAG TPA: hypothetical protein VKF41_09105, partial [Bryobacteraceae bacterium]|nr:hypothetical protein [Bryobacteraceae bacterium]